MEGLCGALGVGIRFSKRRGKALKIEVGEVVPDEDLFKEVFSSVWRLFLHCRKWRMDEKSRLRERFSRPCRWSSVHVLSFTQEQSFSTHIYSTVAAMWCRSFGASGRLGTRRFHGPVQKHIEEKLLTALRPLHLEVKNESHGRKADESHFHVLVVAEAFDELKPLERHRMVNSLFTAEVGWTFLRP